MKKRITALLLAVVSILSMLTAPASAAAPDTIKMDDCAYSGTKYDSPALGECYMHQMHFALNGKSTMGFCAEKGKGMGWSLKGHTWGNPKPISDPTVKTMMAYFYAHSTGVFTDQAKALGVDDVWDSNYTWTMNSWTQAVVWRYKAGLLSDPVVACAEELLCVYNNLEHTSYTSIDDTMDGRSFRDRAQYILDLGAQGVWGECSVYEYAYTGPGSNYHPANDVQAVMVGELNITRQKYELTVKKVDSTNPNKGLAGARFLVSSENGAFSKEIVTGQDGTYTLTALDAGTYAVTELEAPEGYEIDNAGPQYVVLPSNGNNTVTVTFADTPTITGEGSIRKVDADDPTKGLAGAVIKIEGVDNDFTGTYVTGTGGYLTDVPWKDMPLGSYTAEEVTPPEGYTKSPDVNKTKQTFRWDGKTDIALVFENDAKVKVKLIKLDDSDNPLPGAVFNIIKDGQIIGTEATKADGSITVTDVTEGMYAFVEVSAPAPYATLTEPVIAHVDQATINGGGTVTVTAADKKLPSLSILKRDAQTKEVIPGTVFEVKGIHYGYHNDVTTGPDGKAVLTNIPVDSYEIIEKSVPDPYVVGDEPMQTIYLGPGEEQELIFDNLKQPLLTIAKLDADTNDIIPGTVFTIEAIDGDYRNDVTTGADGTVSLRLAPGSYKITEKSVPAPYYLPSKNADREQTVSLNPGDEKTLTFKDHKAPELTIFKEDSVAGAPIEGAKFHVTYTSNGEAADAPGSIDYGYIFTDANGQIKVHEQGKKMYPGEYTVTEVAPAPGFQMKEPTTQRVIIHGGESKTLTFQNEPLNGIIVEKYDSVTHEALPGCTFQLRYLGGTSGTGGTVIGQKVTGKNGTAIWTGLKSGTYVVEEVDPADGYSIINASETVFLADSGEQSVVTVRFDNAPDGILLIRKVCSVNPSITLQDAEFKIMYADGTLIGDSNGIYRTDENGEIRISGLKPGKSVVVTETRAPAGFIIDSQSQTVQIKEGRTVTLTFKNQPKGSLIIQKRDSLTGQPLPGAEFRLATAAGCEVGLDGVIGDSTLTQNGLFITDSNGEIRVTNLAPGAYVLTETKAPAGYVMDSPSTNVVIGANGDTQTVIITNTPKGGLIVEKYDSVTKLPLSGAQFKITNANGELTPDNEGLTSSNGLYTTDRGGQIVLSKLLPGTYVVSEVKAPDNYQADPTPQTVVVNAGDTQTLRFYDDPLCTLTILKRDAVTKKPLKGAEFLVRDSEGRAIGPNNGRYITGTDGTVTVSGLAPNATIVVSESKAPTGYIKDETPKNIVVRTGIANSLIFDNEPATTLIIRKFIEGTENEPLSGVCFKVVDGSGAAVGPDDGCYYTDKAGEIVLDGIEPGTTVIAREIKTVEGYVLDGTPQDILIKAGEVQQLTFWNKKAGTLVIQKKDSVSGNLIAGAQFQLTYASGGYVDNDNGHLSSNGLYTTDDKGEIRVSGVTGTIVAKEVKAAPGYVIDQSTQTQTVTVNPEDTQTLVFLNEPLCSLTLTKLDSMTGKPVPGTEFTVKDGNGTVLGRYTTGKDGTVTVSGLVPGSTVVVSESKVPSGYVLNTTPQTIIVRNGSNSVTSGTGGSSGGGNTGNNGGTGGNDLTFENDPKTRLVIEKYVTGTTDPLKGVTFLVTESNGQVVGSSNGEYITDENGRIVIEGLEPGVTITAKEIKTLEGYVLDTTPKSIKIKVGEAQTLRFYNQKQGCIVVKKLDKQTGEPLAGVEFQITYSDGSYLDDDYGHLSSKGLYKTDANGEIRISGVVGTLVITETKPLPGYVMDEGSRTQTVKVNPTDTQTITVYNTKIGGLTIIKKDEETGERIKGVQFEIRKLNGEIVGTYTTDQNGVISLPEAEKGWYQVTELKAAKGYQLDDTPHQIEVKDGGTATLEITNRQTGSALIHKVDSLTGEGIYGVTFLLSDAKGNPVGTYQSDNEGYVYIDQGLADGKYTIREIECADGYILDTQPKTIYVQYGGCTTITWPNTAVRGQIQIVKKSADYNPTNGLPAGTLLEGATFEIYNERNGNKVDTIVTGANGLASSKALPLGRYTIRETKAPANYGASSETYTAVLEYSGQIVKLEITNKSLSTGVSIEKTGPKEATSGQPVRYVFSRIGNTSNVMLQSFYWRDTLPAAVRLDKVVTGTYNFPGTYKIVYKVNNTGDYRTLADSLSTSRNYTLAASPTALGLAANERVTEIMFVFGQVPGGFSQVEAPMLHCKAVSGLTPGSSFVNVADVGGTHDGVWVQAVSRWVTTVYGKPTPLPKTGY
ncbi:MSCRAMM family protein [Acutalibacter intestini]|uniref:MSCRAMM family protein n=1 Tax=Acutalibacter intestini TaxID=3093659 RepID=UPI002AC8FC19|nr:SpaA isopeptide-forming pilin-related protein [Acutalibacter sp. M00204]